MDIDQAFRQAQILQRDGKKDEARKLYEVIVARNPNQPEILRHYCELLSTMGDVPGAEKIARHIVALDPCTGVNWCMLAGCLSWRGEHEEAGRLYEKGLALSPNMPNERWNYALNLLMRGRYQAGWEQYRWGAIDKKLRTRSLKPEWDGEPIPGKTLFIWCEQGNGDAIQMVRFLADARKAGGCAKIVLECHEPLVKLFMENGVADEVYAIRMDGGTPWEWDEHCSVISLPRLLGVEFDVRDLGGTRTYLSAEPLDLPGNGLRVGICTKGNPSHANDANRSIGQEAFGNLLKTAGCAFYNLDRDSSSLPMADFSQTARIIAGMDLVITVDTAIAHLAGAMGKQVWVLLPFAGDWRWGYEGVDTPWYPSAYLFRQQKHGDWASVIERVQDSLWAHTDPELKAVIRVGWESIGGTQQGLVPFEEFEAAVDAIPRAGTTRHAQLLHGLVRWLQPEIVVEVGTWHGYTGIWMARALQENGRGEIYCIDDFSLGVGAIALDELQENIQSCGTGEVMAILPGKSSEVEWPENVDLAYIDGDHSLEGCAADFERADRAGAKCIVVHDTTSWWGPREFAEAMGCQSGWQKIEGMFDEGLTVFMRRQEKPHPTYTREAFPTGNI